MNQKRQAWIEQLEYVTTRLRDENVSQEEVEKLMHRLEVDLDRLPPFTRYHLYRLESEISSLREEIRARSQDTVRCAYTDDRSNVLEMLSGLPGRLDNDVKYISKKTFSNEWMIIADPYFLQWSGPNRAFASEKKYIEFIANLIPYKLERLELFILPGPHKRVFKKFNDQIRSRGTHVKYWETSEIHDRVIIRDNNTATLMGTSFGGYGNKLSFVLDIPPKDLENFMSELKRIRETSGLA
ncbi:hypothetical protein ACT2FY_18210 [Paraburkholderia fungorum]|uniref:hypothetical protein n=1 Tax=Paraburkholderia fungorum TaxID=134537 RepID=UPI00402B0738